MPTRGNLYTEFPEQEVLYKDSNFLVGFTGFASPINSGSCFAAIRIEPFGMNNIKNG